MIRECTIILTAAALTVFVSSGRSEGYTPMSEHTLKAAPFMCVRHASVHTDRPSLERARHPYRLAMGNVFLPVPEHETRDAGIP